MRSEVERPHRWPCSDCGDSGEGSWDNRMGLRDLRLHIGSQKIPQADGLWALRELKM